MSAMADEPKREVRAALRAARRGIAAARDVADDDEAVARAILALLAAEELGSGATVTLYESLPGEPPTTATIAVLHAAGVRVLVPITRPDFDLDWTDAADEQRRPLGVEAIGAADLVLAPGLSVDASGTRLGQGGGCYDRALPRRAAEVKTVVVLHPEEDPGPLRAEEVPVLALPRDPHDIPVDGVVTAAGHHWLRAGRP